MRRTVRRVVPTTALAIFACLVGFVEWPRAAPKRADGLDQTIQFSCERSMPPKRGDAYYLVILQAPDSGDMIVSQIEGLENIQWPAEYPSAVQVCRFINYGQSPVLNVQADLAVDFMEPIKNEGGGITAGQSITPKVNLRNRVEQFVHVLSRQFRGLLRSCDAPASDARPKGRRSIMVHRGPHSSAEVKGRLLFTAAAYKSSNRVASIPKATRVTRRNIAVNVPRRSFALIDVSVSDGRP